MNNLPKAVTQKAYYCTTIYSPLSTTFTEDLDIINLPAVNYVTVAGKDILSTTNLCPENFTLYWSFWNC